MSNGTNTTTSLPLTKSTSTITNSTSTTSTSTVSGTFTSTVSDTLTSTISSIISSSISSTISPNTTTDYENCLLKNSSTTCRLADFIRVLAYLLLAVSLLPQIIHLVNHGSKYIAGISYMWLIIRVLGLASLMVAHAFKWSSLFELIALISTIIIFLQIFIYADNLHRQQKIVLLAASLLTWIVGGSIILLARKHESFLITTGYLLLAFHTLPQILLNSLLRTAKALSKFSILFLAMSDTLLFANSYTLDDRYVYLVAYYYAFSFFLFIYLQSIVYGDSHIYLISRSAHTVLTPGVNLYTGLDASGARSSGQEPQMFSIDDLEPGDSTDVVYQPVTSNKPSESIAEQTPMKRIVWYATLASIIAIEVALTIMLFHRAWSIWIVLVPLSIPLIVGIFFLLRTKLNVLHTESLRKIL